eukprot:jgi/Tetstr1/463785/TSEL_008601.t1
MLRACKSAAGASQSGGVLSRVWAPPAHQLPRRRLRIFAAEGREAAGGTRRPRGPFSFLSSEPDVLTGKKKWLFGSELLQRLLVTLGWGAFVIAGTYVPMPWIDSQLLAHTSSTAAAVPAELQILSLIKAPPAVPMNMFTLGVEPLISANIVFAVFRLVAKLDVLGEPLFPPLKDYFRSSEQDPRGRMQIERYVSQLVSCFAVVKAYFMAREVAGLSFCWGGFFVAKFIVYHLASVHILRNITFEIDEGGLGDGMTFLICLNIVAGLTIEYERIISLGLLGLVPASLAVKVAGVLVLLICCSVLLSKIKLQLKTQFYGKTAPLATPDMPSTPLHLSRFTLQRVNVDKSSDVYLTIQPTPNGTQPLLTANIIVLSLPLLISTFPSMVPLATAFQASALMPITIAVTAFSLNFFMATAMAGETVKYMSNIKSRVVGIPPGSVMKKGVLYLVKLTSTLGGLVLAILAWVVAAIDQYSLANYGFSPGCTGFILIAGFVTSAMDKAAAVKARTRISDAFDKERRAIPDKMEVL